MIISLCLKGARPGCSKPAKYVWQNDICRLLALRPGGGDVCPRPRPKGRRGCLLCGLLTSGHHALKRHGGFCFRRFPHEQERITSHILTYRSAVFCKMIRMACCCSSSVLMVEDYIHLVRGSGLEGSRFPRFRYRDWYSLWLRNCFLNSRRLVNENAAAHTFHCF